MVTRSSRSDLYGPERDTDHGIGRRRGISLAKGVCEHDSQQPHSTLELATFVCFRSSETCASYSRSISLADMVYHGQPATLDDLVERRDFSVFGPFVGSLASSSLCALIHFVLIL